MADAFEPPGAHAASDEAPTIATVSRRSFWGSLVTRTLPSYTGPHPVGVAECVPCLRDAAWARCRPHECARCRDGEEPGPGARGTSWDEPLTPYRARSIEVPVERQTFGEFEHSKIPGSAAGLALETVLFTLFYPAVVSTGSSDRVLWFPKLKQTVDGFLKMVSPSARSQPVTLTPPPQGNVVPNHWYRLVA